MRFWTASEIQPTPSQPEKPADSTRTSKRTGTKKAPTESKELDRNQRNSTEAKGTRLKPKELYWNQRDPTGTKETPLRPKRLHWNHGLPSNAKATRQAPQRRYATTRMLSHLLLCTSSFPTNPENLQLHRENHQLHREDFQQHRRISHRVGEFLTVPGNLQLHQGNHQPHWKNPQSHRVTDQANPKIEKRGIRFPIEPFGVPRGLTFPGGGTIIGGDCTREGGTKPSFHAPFLISIAFRPCPFPPPHRLVC